MSFCKYCQKELVRKHGETSFNFKKRLTCGHSCVAKSIKLHTKPKNIGTKTKELWKDPSYVAHMVMAHTGKKQSRETIEKRVSKIRGDKNHAWKGGVATEAEIVRKSWAYRDWRRAVFQRDNYTCQNCNVKSGLGFAVVLNAHHIKPFSQYPELRFELSNGLTLCKACHLKTETYGRKKKNN